MGNPYHLPVVGRDEAAHPRSAAMWRIFRILQVHPSSWWAGKSHKEAMRCLKRHLSNVVYRHLVADAERGEQAA
jgi:hypothetical protein